MMKADYGATLTYLKESHVNYFQNIQKLLNEPRAILPNNDTIATSEQDDLSLHPLLNPKTLVYPQLQCESLLSIGQLCDDDCIVVFDKKKLYVYKQEQLILQGNYKKRLFMGCYCFRV